MNKSGCVEAFKRRRAKRLKERGYRHDAPEESENNGNNSNNRNGNSGNSGGGSSGSSGGGSGGRWNLKLPFGLCMRYGIKIDPSWAPRDAWDALAVKGITPGGAFERLRRGEDPGKPDKPSETDKPNQKTAQVKATKVKTDNGEFDKLVGGKDNLVKDRGWRVRGVEVGGSSVLRPVKRFRTKTDMMAWLKEQGVQEFTDENKKTVNPQEFEVPKAVYKGDGASYTNVKLGHKAGEFVLSGTDMDGKECVIQTFSSGAKAKKMLTDAGTDLKDVKITPEAKRVEKGRLAWLSSDKKEYLETTDGIKFGQLTLSESHYAADMGAPWSISGMDEEGNTHKFKFKTKNDAMAYMKKQGVQKASDTSKHATVDPQQYEAKGTESTEPVTEKREGMSDEERAKWKQEFPSKAEWFGKENKYADIYLSSDGIGIGSIYTFYGYDKNGNKKKLASMRGMNNVVQYIKDNAKYPADRYIKNERLKKEYDQYEKIHY